MSTIYLHLSRRTWCFHLVPTFIGWLIFKEGWLVLYFLITFSREMRLYPTHIALSTPFVVYFNKKAKFFLTFKLIPLKTKTYRLKIFLTFFKNIRVSMDMKTNRASALSFFRCFAAFFLPKYLVLGKTLCIYLISASMLLCTIHWQTVTYLASPMR